VFGVLALISSIPLVCFPRYLKSNKRRKDLVNIGKEMESRKAAGGDTVLAEVKGTCCS